MKAPSPVIQHQRGGEAQTPGFSRRLDSRLPPPLQVSGRRALQWCEETGAEYFEGSAKEDRDVEKPFLRAAQRGLQQVRQSGFHLYSEKEEKDTFSLCLTCLFFDDKRYITPYSTKNTHWKIQDISR